MSKKKSMAADLINAVEMCTRDWTRTIEKEERNPVSRRYRFERMTRKRGIQFKEAAWEIMEEAYNKASGNGAYPANARQIMYAARPHIQQKVGKPLQSAYFTQTLLPNYIEEHGYHHCTTAYDARGHFAEPHGGKRFGVGTLEVRDYLRGVRDPSLIEAALSAANISCYGPKHNFGALLFIEKEGFDPLLKSAQIANRFDTAIMSTKGVSVTAARELADQICADHDIPLLTLHDFDKAGFTIAGTMQRDTRRYEFRNDIEVINLGLTLADVQEMNLEFEHQFIPKGRKSAMMANLRENGATEEEIAFMFADFDATRSLRRVELNAMTSPQFVEFLERKLRKAGVEKIAPDADELADAYRLFANGGRIQDVVDKAIEELDNEDVEVPDDLEKHVRDYLAKHPEVRWDQAIASIVGAAEGTDE
jgi:hypothetical protein